ncbi:hypothetical protein GCM10010342_71770 [Streptomyces anulatus]|nr:hypothetical protein GCM10010342_71770 [Streptomyces anulatus]
MSTHQAPGAVNEPTGPTLNETTGPTLVATPPWARVETPQGRSHAESSSRTADRAAHTPADDTTQVSAVLDPPAQGSSIMTRDNVPNPAQPSTSVPAQPPSDAVPVQPADPAPAVRQAAIGAGVPAAIVQGVAQGAAQGASRTFLARLTEEFLADPPDWVRTLGSFVRGLWQG